MPIYEYRCQSCGHVFDKLVRSFSSTIEIACPVCQSADCHKNISLFGTTSRSGGSVSASNCSPTGG